MAKNKLRWLDNITTWLVAIGGLNWGLDALNLNAVDWLAGLVNMPGLATFIYGAVGVSSVYFGARFLMGKIKAM